MHKFDRKRKKAYQDYLKQSECSLALHAENYDPNDLQELEEQAFSVGVSESRLDREER